MKRTIKSVFVLAFAVGLALAGAAPASAHGVGGGVGSVTAMGIGCCRGLH